MAKQQVNKKVIRLNSRGVRVRIVKSASAIKIAKKVAAPVTVDDDSGRGLAYTSGETWRKSKISHRII